MTAPPDKDEEKRLHDLDERTTALEALAASAGWQAYLRPIIAGCLADAMGTVRDLSNPGHAPKVEHARAIILLCEELLKEVETNPKLWRAELKRRGH